MSESVRLGLIGFGEVGFKMAEGLKRNGLEEVYAYDPALVGENSSQIMVRRADHLRVKVCSNIEELVGKADVIFSVNTASVAVKAAEEAASHLNAGHLYVDLNTASPQIQEEIRKVLEPSACKLVDAAIMGAISSTGHATSIIASGDGRKLFREIFSQFGMDIDSDLVEEAGQASAVKLYRSVFSKGIETLVIEMLLSSHRDGLSDQVFNLVCNWMNSQDDFFTVFKMLTVMHAVHARRRTVEMEHVCQSLEKVGLKPLMSDATRRVMKRTSDLGSQSEFTEVDPEIYMKVIEFIDKGIEEGGGETV